VGVAPPGFNGVGSDPHGHRFLDSTAGTSRIECLGNAGYGSYLYGSPNWLALQMLGRLQQESRPNKRRPRLKPPFENALANASPVDPNEQKPVLVLSGVRGVENLLRDDTSTRLRFLMSMVATGCCSSRVQMWSCCCWRGMPAGLRNSACAGRWEPTSAPYSCKMLGESMVLVVAGAALGWLFAGSRDASAGGMVWRRPS